MNNVFHFDPVHYQNLKTLETVLLRTCRVRGIGGEIEDKDVLGLFDAVVLYGDTAIRMLVRQGRSDDSKVFEEAQKLSSLASDSLKKANAQRDEAQAEVRRLDARIDDLRIRLRNVDARLAAVRAQLAEAHQNAAKLIRERDQMAAAAKRNGDEVGRMYTRIEELLRERDRFGIAHNVRSLYNLPTEPPNPSTTIPRPRGFGGGETPKGIFFNFEASARSVADALRAEHVRLMAEQGLHAPYEAADRQQNGCENTGEEKAA